MPPATPLIVVRLGGSLLNLPTLHTQLHQLTQLLLPARILIITGGGRAADSIRQLDNSLKLPAKITHWQAIAAMSSNAQLLVRTGNALKSARDHESAQNAWEDHCTPVLDVHTWLLGPGKTTADSLPESWQVTSDSIAAAVATAWQSSRLVLAKSCPPPALNVHELAAAGAVDQHFPTAAHNLMIDWCCLRHSSSPKIVHILPQNISPSTTAS
jgi:aspartokinase-like uncharacterized kinase